jgi:hypothetical protein
MLGQKHGVWHRSTPKTQGRSASELAHLGFWHACHQHMASWQQLCKLMASLRLPGSSTRHWRLLLIDHEHAYGLRRAHSRHDEPNICAMKGILASMTTDGRENRKLHTPTSLCILSLSLSSFDIQRLNADKRPPLRAQRARIIYKASSIQLIELSSRMASSRLPSPFFSI